MGSFVSWLLDSSGYVPRAQCGSWSRERVLLHNLSDGAIWLAYVLIPIILVTFARKRRDLPFPWLFVLFGAFIIGCGFTHLIDVMMFYYPMYNLSGAVKLVTAIVSLATVAALVPVIPKALALRSPDELEREITERIRAEERLKVFARELERSNRDLDEFATVASHDLQEPLRKIQKFGDRLIERYGPILGPDGRDALERMQNASTRMSGLIDNLLEYSRVTSKVMPFEPVDLHRLIEGVVSDLETRIQESGGRVEIGQLPTIRADQSQIRRLFQNLIGNGLKFAREGVPPVVSVTSRATTLAEGVAAHELIVSDNGIGFDMAYRERVFELFQRLHGRNEYEGTGIGLPVCRKIAERHGGQIAATSRVGQGSTFVVTLPDDPNPARITP